MMLARIILAVSFGLVGFVASLFAYGDLLIGLAVYCALGSALLLLSFVWELPNRSVKPSSLNFPRAGKGNPNA
jgi:hypothetical protein